MKVLHINCNYVGTALHRIMVMHMRSLIDDVTVFTPIWNRKQYESFNPTRNEIVRVCFNKSDRFFYFYKQHKIIHTVIREVEDLEKYSIIHAFTLLTDGNVAFKLSKKYKIPFVVAIRDTDINQFFRLKPYLIPLGVKILRNAESIYLLSSTYKSIVIDKYIPLKYKNEIEKKMCVIPNGIDDFWHRNLYLNRNLELIENKIKTKQLTVICVGKINKRKNIPHLQKALQLLRNYNWTIELVLVGKIEDESEYELIKQDKYTRYYPPKNKEELIELYRMADVFALASHTETFGLVYAEAMSQGLPVIYSRGQGFDGQFPEGEVGYAVSDVDPQEIVDAIIKICNNYSYISSNAIAKTSRFNWDDICKEYVEKYKEISNV